MKEDNVESLIEIARIHETRLLTVLKKIESIFPLTTEKVEQFTDEEIFFTDFFANRFCKLQDLMGSNLIDAVLIHMNEFSDDFTMIDKMNKLEKFHLIEDAHTWRVMRTLRNHLIHEYPHNPELVAKFLNQAYSLTPELLKILNNILNKLEGNDPR